MHSNVIYCKILKSARVRHWKRHGNPVDVFCSPVISHLWRLQALLSCDSTGLVYSHTDNLQRQGSNSDRVWIVSLTGCRPGFGRAPYAVTDGCTLFSSRLISTPRLPAGPGPANCSHAVSGRVIVGWQTNDRVNQLGQHWISSRSRCWVCFTELHWIPAAITLRKSCSPGLFKQLTENDTITDDSQSPTWLVISFIFHLFISFFCIFFFALSMVAVYFCQKKRSRASALTFHNPCSVHWAN